MRTRYYSHFKDAFNHKSKHKHTDRFHSFVAWNSLGTWLMVPIFLPINSVIETNRVEKRIIRSFGDATLNSQHVLLRNRFVLGPKYNNRHSSPARSLYIRHRHDVKHIGNTCSDTHISSPTRIPMRFQLLEHKRFFGSNVFVHHSMCYDLRRLLNLPLVKSCHLYKLAHMVKVIGSDISAINWTSL